jgi:hypothetical protein
VARNIRFGEYLQKVTVDTASIGYEKLLPKPHFDAEGREIPRKPEKLQMSGGDIVNLLQPYLSVRFMEQARAVIPLAIFLALFQWLVLQRRRCHADWCRLARRDGGPDDFYGRAQARLDALWRHYRE